MWQQKPQKLKGIAEIKAINILKFSFVFWGLKSNIINYSFMYPLIKNKNKIKSKKPKTIHFTPLYCCL